MYRMFIDDERFPPNNEADWVICRTLDQVKQTVAKQGFPSFISWDHDLGYNQPTGMDIAHWLVELDLDHDVMPKNFDFYVHSQNFVGAQNITGLLRGYMATKA